MRLASLLPKPRPSAPAKRKPQRLPLPHGYVAPKVPCHWEAGILPKLEVGDVNDPLERDADALADRVLRIPGPSHEASNALSPEPAHGEPDIEDGDEELIEAPGVGAFTGAAVLPAGPGFVAQRRCISCHTEEEEIRQPLARAASPLHAFASRTNNAWHDLAYRSPAPTPPTNSFAGPVALHESVDCWSGNKPPLNDWLVGGRYRTCPAHDALRRACASCEAEGTDEIMREAAGGWRGGETSGLFTEQLRQRIRGAGQPLSPYARSFLEPRLGVDLGHLRVHHDAAADSLAQRINARAFTFGKDIFFRLGEPEPTTQAGMRLLAHEVAHTLQRYDPPQLGTNRAQDVPSPIRRAPATTETFNMTGSESTCSDGRRSTIAGTIVTAKTMLAKARAALEELLNPSDAQSHSEIENIDDQLDDGDVTRDEKKGLKKQRREAKRKLKQNKNNRKRAAAAAELTVGDLQTTVPGTNGDVGKALTDSLELIHKELGNISMPKPNVTQRRIGQTTIICGAAGSSSCSSGSRNVPAYTRRDDKTITLCEDTFFGLPDQHRGAILIHELVHILHENRGFDIYTWDRGFPFLSRRKDLAGVAMENPDTLTTFVIHAAEGRRGIDSDSPFREPSSDGTKIELMGKRKIAVEQALGLAGFWLIAARETLRETADRLLDPNLNNGLTWNDPAFLSVQRGRNFIASLRGESSKAGSCANDLMFVGLECTVGNSPITSLFDNGSALLPIETCVAETIAIINDARVAAKRKGPSVNIEVDTDGNPKVAVNFDHFTGMSSHDQISEVVKQLLRYNATQQSSHPTPDAFADRLAAAVAAQPDLPA